MPASPQLTLDLPDAEATARLGRALATVVGAGDVLCLEGPLGAGKSHLARAVIQTLQSAHGTPEHVPSPTYTLVQTYSAGALSILHADLYRLAEASELDELGLAEAMGTDLCLIEWPDRLGDLAPGNALWVTLAPDGDGRRATLGGGWPQQRLDRLKAAFDG